jgi:carotenoid 1,2-hydratase
VPVAAGGYAWWYIDAVSDDGAYGIALIAFLGSVFSPYYAWSRRFGSDTTAADPLRHCAINVALYGHRKRRWALTERGRYAVQREANQLIIGPSSLAWDGTTLTARIDEVTAPLPSRIRGVVRLHPTALEHRVAALDTAGSHRWQPIAPCARIEVDLDRPALYWSGPAYCDTNVGDAPLEADFLRWDWFRSHTADGTTVLYDVTSRSGMRLALAMRYGAGGGVTDFDPPAERTLRRTRWGVARALRGDAAEAAQVVATLQDTPFYARSLVSTRLLGTPMVGMHESLDLQRFRNPWVQAMLPFRMPRAWR